MKQKRRFLFVFSLPKLVEIWNKLRVCITFTYVLTPLVLIKKRLRRALRSVESGYSNDEFFISPVLVFPNFSSFLFAGFVVLSNLGFLLILIPSTSKMIRDLISSAAKGAV